MTFNRVTSANITKKPYRYVVDIEILFSGSSGYVEGSGIIIGENDILTASHVVYSPGKTIQDIRIYAARSDVSGSDAYMYSYTGEAQFDYNLVGNGDGTISFSDVGNDYAVIGISEAIGNVLGYASLSSTAYVGQTTSVIGYGTNVDVNVIAADLTGVTTDVNRTTNIIRFSNDISPGNSGGPILQTINDQAVVVGVVSGAGGYGAFLDTETIAEIRADMNSNDVLLQNIVTLSGSSTSDSLTGTPGFDYLNAGAGNDFLIGSSGSDVLIGGSGIDTVVYTYARAGVNVTIESSDTFVSVNYETDHLTEIERINFSDGTLVLDVVNDIAAVVYRLYRASFGRTPDNLGLSENVSAIEDRGLSLKELAAAFLVSAEFKDRYGSDVPTSVYVDLLYNNVLSRSPDDEGFAAWSNNINAGLISKDDALVGFSDSQENINVVSASIASDGIWLV